jgi:hypothetical protein
MSDRSLVEQRFWQKTVLPCVQAARTRSHQRRNHTVSWRLSSSIVYNLGAASDGDHSGHHPRISPISDSSWTWKQSRITAHS